MEATKAKELALGNAARDRLRLCQAEVETAIDHAERQANQNNEDINENDAAGAASSAAVLLRAHEDGIARLEAELKRAQEDGNCDEDTIAAAEAYVRLTNRIACLLVAVE